MKTLRIHSPILVKSSVVVNTFSDAPNRIVGSYDLIRVRFVKILDFFFRITELISKKLLRLNISFHNIIMHSYRWFNNICLWTSKSQLTDIWKKANGKK